VQDIVTEPEYLDIALAANTEFTHPVKQGHTVLAYIIEGQGYFTEESDLLNNGELVWYGDGGKINVRTTEESVCFLLISGKPIGEPVAWYGPIVMNTDEELQTAFEEYENGTFIKHK
jgi:redox-sensitive bicupin YhaK (pirin superfamily)